jgi:hypothetical protein
MNKSNLNNKNQSVNQVNLINSAREESDFKMDLDYLVKKTEGWGIEEPLLTRWVHEYGVNAVLEKINKTKLYSPKHPGAYLHKVVRSDLEEKHTPCSKNTLHNALNSSTEKLYPTAEENVCWYDKLTENEKLKLLKEAVWKFPWFEEHLKCSKLSVLDKGFSQSLYFTLMMEIIDRADNNRRPTKQKHHLERI